MDIKVINGERVGVPTVENNYLCNERLQLTATKIYFGKEDDGSEWTEVTEEEKVRLESEWNAEDFTEVTEQDYQNALAEMGVEL